MYVRTCIDELRQRRQNLSRTLAGSCREKPRDRQACQSLRKGAQRGCGPAVGPLHVIKADE